MFLITQVYIVYCSVFAAEFIKLTCILYCNKATIINCYFVVGVAKMAVVDCYDVGQVVIVNFITILFADL